jgi:hypothetical protein
MRFTGNTEPLPACHRMADLLCNTFGDEPSKRDRIELQFKMEPRLIMGDHKNEGKAAIACGPLVLAAGEALVGPQARKLSDVTPAGSDLAALHVRREPAPQQVRSWPGMQVFRINAITRRTTASLPAGAPVHFRLIPLANAGGIGMSYKVWLPLGLSTSSGNLLLDGQETRSRTGNVGGLIIDDDFESLVVTSNQKLPVQDWYAVTLDKPVSINRVVFAHGRTFPDGGWFDASAGKPRIQVKSTKDAEWETVAEVKDYPATTATDPAGLKDGQPFTSQLPASRKITAIGVIGKPASGDNPKQAFSSCTELQAFEAR